MGRVELLQVGSRLFLRRHDSASSCRRPLDSDSTRDEGDCWPENDSRTIAMGEEQAMDHLLTDARGPRAIPWSKMAYKKRDRCER
jgi:hypothetical protein